MEILLAIMFAPAALAFLLVFAMNLATLNPFSTATDAEDECGQEPTKVFEKVLAN